MCLLDRALNGKLLAKNSKLEANARGAIEPAVSEASAMSNPLRALIPFRSSDGELSAALICSRKSRNSDRDLMRHLPLKTRRFF